MVNFHFIELFLFMLWSSLMHFNHHHNTHVKHDEKNFCIIIIINQQRNKNISPCLRSKIPSYFFKFTNWFLFEDQSFACIHTHTHSYTTIITWFFSFKKKSSATFNLIVKNVSKTHSLKSKHWKKTWKLNFFFLLWK